MRILDLPHPSVHAFPAADDTRSVPLRSVAEGIVLGLIQKGRAMSIKSQDARIDYERNYLAAAQQFAHVERF